MRFRFPVLLLAATFAAVVLAGCQNQPGSSTAPSKSAGTKVYDVTGKVVSLYPTKKLVTLDHEDIPGFMKAMTMEFPVADAKLLDGMKAGDAVRGKITVEGGSYAVTSLEKR
ncbi:MAG: copper-binding protein [Gemmataceae bacterium]